MVMNIEDLKGQARAMTTPPEVTPVSHVESFLTKMKERDRTERRRLIVYSSIIFSVGIVFFSVARLRHASGILLLAIGYLAIAGVAWLKARAFDRVRYTGTTSAFLAGALDRYRFWRPTDWLFAVPLGLLLAYSGAVTIQETASRYLGPAGQEIALVAYGVFLLLVVCMGVMFSRKDWNRQNAQVIAEIKKMQKELANG
jgi:hypothetical protein